MKRHALLGLILGLLLGQSFVYLEPVLAQRVQPSTPSAVSSNTVCIDNANKDTCLTRGAANTLKVATTAAGTTAATVYAAKFTTTGTATFAYTLATGEAIGNTADGSVTFTDRAGSGGQPLVFVQSVNSLQNTSGAQAIVGIGDSTVGFAPASGSGSFAAVHVNPTINGTSSGTAYGIGIASKTNTLTGGNIRLFSAGTSTTDLFTGYTERAYIDTAGIIRSSMGTGTGFATTVGVASINTTSTASTQTAKETLMTYSLPANSFSSNGKCVRITGWGTAKATANNKTQTIDFGGVTVANTGAVANNAGFWKVATIVCRVSSGNQTSFQEQAQSAATTAAAATTALTATDTGAIAIDLTSTNVTDTDGTVAKGLLVEFLN